MPSIAVLITAIIPIIGYAQDGKKNLFTLRGSISSADGLPLPFVTVLIKNGGEGTLTDENGDFKIEKIRTGSYTIEISLSGAIDSMIAFEITNTDPPFLRVQFRRTYAELKSVIVSAGMRSGYAETKISESMRLHLPINEIPQNIIITGKQLIFDQGLLSMSESIRTSSGVVKTYGGLNDYSLFIRGTDATFNVFRNGVGGYFWNQQEDAAMLEKIEFIKGPAAFLVSIAQPGGIINNVTKQPVNERISNLQVGYGSYNMMRAYLDLNGELDKQKKLTYRLNLGAHKQERFFQYSNANRYFGCAALKYEADSKTVLSAEFNYMHGKTSGNNTDVPSVKGKMFILPIHFAVADAATDVIDAKDIYYRVHLNHDFNESWHVYAQVAYVHGSWGGNMLDADDSVPVSNDTLYRASNYDRFRNFSIAGNAYIDGKFYTGPKIEHRILAGIDYCHAGYDDLSGGTWGDQKFGLFLNQPKYYVNPDSLKNFPVNSTSKLRWGWFSIYAQDNVKVVRKLLFTLAAHYTHAPVYYDDPGVPVYQRNTYHDVITPRAGITWLFSDNFSVYALYDNCFWPQQGKNFEHKSFQPLTGYDLETGVKRFFFSRKLSLNLSLFDIVKNNTLTADPLHFDNLVQKGQITSKGIDFDLSGNITTAISGNMNYSYVDARITKDNDPNNIGLKNFGIPDHSFNLWLKYQLFHGNLKNISFGVGYQYMGRRNAEVNWIPGGEIQFLPAYGLLDGLISYRCDRFTIDLNVYNLTNRRYAALGSFNSITNEWRYTPGDPMNFRVSFVADLISFKNKMRK